MTVAVIDVTTEELLRSREVLLQRLRLTPEELRERVRSEVATSEERDALQRLDEISFLLGE
ncbi:hypothetical protein [Saccharomonospora glauca]|jgi:hypothetical protein|uniref:Uncharacterized protein n=1 Tax=Saccharomonospora glauca K62 TaxID=928724 RepID=I1D7U9_9PSEU|nr:hypothetical protein [Saccharomonospora glauca]EIF01024.1 hypothetical protein SacglDRAFT_04193 [Saccharomonospora glauca K62]